MAYEFYMSIEGTKSGKFKGESTREAWKDKMPGIAFRSEVVSPRDMSAGSASGRRQHRPLLVSKKIGASTPLIANALCQNEVLKSVLLEFPIRDAAGKETVAFTIKLTNATIAGHRIVLPDFQGEQKDRDVMEEVEFTYQKIEWEHKIAKTMAMDDWNK